MEAARAALAKAAAAPAPDALLAWLDGGKAAGAAAATADLTALVATFESSACSRLLTALTRHVEGATERLAQDLGLVAEPGAGSVNDENAGAGAGAGASAATSAAQALALLRGAARLLSAVCDNCCEPAPSSANGAPPLPRSFMEAASALHNSISVVQSSSREGRACIASIVRLCERVYLARGEAANALLPLAVYQLMLDAATLPPPPSAGEPPPPAAAATQRRLWALTARGALAVFDLDDDSCDTIREAMLRSFTSHRMLSAPTGRNLLAAFATLSPALTRAAHATIKAQFPAPARCQEWFGAVYLRAWETSEGAARICVEEACLQDLLQRGVHAAEPATFEAVRRVLAHFLSARDRRRKGVDAMLARVAAPILWRALECANAAVRRNAATVLRDAFPLGLSECAAAERDALVGHQLQALCLAADDDCPGVREVGTAALGLALERFWEVLPVQARLRLLERLGSRAEDSRAPGVRTAALQAVSALVEAQPLSHAELLARGALPPLCRLVHDKSERVRAAAVQLLLAIERNRGILGAPLDGHVEAEQVLSRLVLDAHTPAVAEGLARLLLRSFFPPADVRAREVLGSAPAAAAARVLEGLRAWELATLTFLAYAPRFAPSLVPRSLLVAVVAKLHAAVHKCAAARADATAATTVAGANAKGSKRGRVAGQVSAVGGNEAPGAVVAAAAETTPPQGGSLRELANILRAIATLWSGLEASMATGPATAQRSGRQRGASAATAKKGRRAGKAKGKAAAEDGDEDDGDAAAEGEADGDDGHQAAETGEAEAEVDPASGGAVAGVEEEAGAVRAQLCALFAGDELPFLLGALSAGPGAPAQAQAHAASIAASLLAIAGHLPPASAAATGLADSLWLQLRAMTPAEALGADSAGGGGGGAALQGLVACLAAWGRARVVMVAAVASLSAAADAVVRACEGGGEAAGAAKAEAECAALLADEGAGPEAPVGARAKGAVRSKAVAAPARAPALMHPVVAAAALERCLALPPGGDMGAGGAAASLASLATMGPTMACLAQGVMALVPALRRAAAQGPPPAGADDAPASAAASSRLAAQLGPACVRAWSRLTVLQLSVRQTAAEAAAAAATPESVDEGSDAAASSMAALSQDNIAEFAGWAQAALLPHALAASDRLRAYGDEAEAEGHAGAVAPWLALRLPSCAAYAVLEELAALAADLLQAGLGGLAALDLFRALTSGAGLALPADEVADVGEGEEPRLSRAAPFDLCTAAQPAGEGNEAEGGAPATGGVPRLHATLLRLGLRLFAASCGNILTTERAPATGELVELALPLPPGTRAAVARTVARLMSAGCMRVGAGAGGAESASSGDGPDEAEDCDNVVDGNDDETDVDFVRGRGARRSKRVGSTTAVAAAPGGAVQLLAAEAAKQLVAEARKSQLRAGGTCTALSGLLQQALPVLEDGVPLDALDALCARGEAFAALQPAAAALLRACTATVSSGASLGETLAARLRLLGGGNSGSALTAASPMARCLALASAALGPCGGPGFGAGSEGRAALRSAVAEVTAPGGRAGKALWRLVGE